ncbi:MAG: thioredoxin family protein [Candidatus Sulfotelmatobacter sp.]|jgi:thioredoxin 1
MKRYSRYLAVLIITAALAVAGDATAQTSASDATTGFPPLDQWKVAVLEGDSIGLKALYSIDPPAQVQANGTKTGGGEDINFWLGLKAKTMKVEIVRLRERTYGKSVIFKATVQTADGRTIDITNAQAWRKDGEQWHVFNVERTDSPHLQQPSDMNKDIYPADKDARTEIKEAEEKAAAQHRRVLLIFGANWCYDCHVLDLALHRPDFQPAVRGYEIVHVDIGPDGTKNADVAKQYDVPLDSGVPALAIIESDGKVVVSQKNGEFEDARALTPEVLLEFLNRWKPEAR